MGQPSEQEPAADRPRGIVVPFRRRFRSAGAMRATMPARRRYGSSAADDALNNEWDRLLTAVIQAWCWRDPDSVVAVERSIVQLRASVDRDWS